MFRKLVLAILVLAVVTASILYFLSAPQPLAASDLPDYQGDADRGQYVFWSGGCASCHAAKGSDDDATKLRLAGGVELETPFGAFVAPNISPHPEAGIGGWSTLDFANAMIRGVSPGGRHYYPAFPYASYQHMTLEDVIDLKAFIDTLEPVAEPAPEHRVGFPFNVRRGLGVWKLLYLDGKPFEPDTGTDDAINRGKYLVEGPSHCGECHTPRTAIGGMDTARWLAGGPAAEGEGSVPNITPHDDGIGSWSAEDIAYMLETGFTPEFDSVGGSMTEVQRNMARLTAEDRMAIALYLKSVTPVSSESN